MLAPEFRAPEEAYLVSRWLIEKAAARLREEGRVAGRFALQISIADRSGWSRSVKCAPAQDTLGFLRINRTLWRSAWPAIRGQMLLSIGVQLSDVQLLCDRSGDLLSGVQAAERSPQEKAAVAADSINRRFGAGTIRYGDNQPHPGIFERG